MGWGPIYSVEPIVDKIEEDVEGVIDTVTDLSVDNLIAL